mmetsp:Transcript_76888/g.204139  ORF Transcript_76888/g.204139 Transcript_76888/m.204139 type:complete len:200 (+) Transcript_76888:287-886(+)
MSATSPARRLRSGRARPTLCVARSLSAAWTCRPPRKPSGRISLGTGPSSTATWREAGLDSRGASGSCCSTTPPPRRRRLKKMATVSMDVGWSARGMSRRRPRRRAAPASARTPTRSTPACRRRRLPAQQTFWSRMPWSTPASIARGRRGAQRGRGRRRRTARRSPRRPGALGWTAAAWARRSRTRRRRGTGPERRSSAR